MNMVLIRKHYTNQSTIGELSVDGEFECYTLEDVVRIVKILGKTAIPPGTYDIGLTYSKRFNKTMPILFNVPGFEGIRIHCGNSAKDTEGCILVGTDYTTANYIGNSRNAYNLLYEKIIAAMSLSERVQIQIVNTKQGSIL